MFSLNLLQENLKKLKPVTGSFDPKSNWSHKYDIFTLAPGIGVKIGEFNIERENISKNKFKLNIKSRKQALDGFYYGLDAEMVCIGDLLGRVVNWKFTGAVFDGSNSEVEHTKLKKKGSICNGNLSICCHNRCVDREIRNRYAFDRSMFEAVQRLDINNEQIDFTYVDDFDQVKFGHSLKAYKNASIELNETLEIKGYEHTGSGIVPYVYWIDKNNRCQFVVTGIEAYILTHQTQV